MHREFVTFLRFKNFVYNRYYLQIKLKLVKERGGSRKTIIKFHYVINLKFHFISRFLSPQ